jgi:predicted flap endonuclease-1-like 5' DNA nuclease
VSGSAVSTGSAAAAAQSAAAAGVRRPITGLGRDNLQRIKQINAEVEKLLNVQGISRYEQIAGWGPSDVTRFDRLLGQAGRIARENWIEQAQILARSGETAYSREFDRRAAELVGEPPRPTRLVEAIRSVAAKAESDPARATRGDNAPVRREPPPEAVHGTDTTGAVVAATSAPQEDPVGGSGRAPPRDDLKRIRGVGVLIETKLNAMGITSYEQIANWSKAEIDRVSQVLDVTGRIERENWVEQARILSSGGQTQFSRRVDRGEIEENRNKT